MGHRILKENGTEHLSKSKKFVFTLLLIVFSIVLVETGLQILYRLSADQWLWQWWTIPIYENDPHRVYRVKENLDYLHKTSEYKARYFTNAQGFRTDKEQKTINVEKPIITYRVMYLGPSFAFGWGVDYEQSYAYLISKGLHASNKKIEIINVGTPSQAMNFQLSWFEKKGYMYAPDIIVQTVFADSCWNIATDGTLPENLPYVKDNYMRYPPAKTSHEVFQRIIKKARLYSALVYFSWRLYATLSPGEEKSGTGEELYNEPTYSETCKPDIILKKYRDYQRFVWGALNKEIPVVFLYIPSSYIVRPADVVRFINKTTKDPLAERLVTMSAQQILNDNGIYFRDLTDALVKADAKNRMYNLYDLHFTPEGNQVVADIATPIIQKVIDASTIEKK